MHAKFRKENRHTQQEYPTRETTTTRKDVQLQIETWLPAKRRMLNYQCHLWSDSGTSDTKETCIGLTGDRFKTRYKNHTCSFRDNSKRNSTELSKYIWSLKDKNIKYTVSWKIMGRAKTYSNMGKKCNLCIMKYFIICKPETCSLNKRNELASACRHANRFSIKND